MELISEGQACGSLWREWDSSPFDIRLAGEGEAPREAPPIREDRYNVRSGPS